EMLIDHVARVHADENEVKRKKAALELADSQNNLDERKVVETWRTDAAMMVDRLMSDTMDASGMGYSDISSRIEKLKNDAAAGRPVDQQEGVAISAGLDQLITHVRTALEQKMIQPWSDDPSRSYAAKMKPDVRK